MTKDDDLEIMFGALRKVDEGLAPSFDEIEGSSRRAVDIKVPATSEKLRWILIAVTAATVLLAVASLAVLRKPMAEVEFTTATPPVEMQHLDEVCNSLLARLSSAELNREMVWVTRTDSLLTSDSITFNIRKSR